MRTSFPSLAAMLISAMGYAVIDAPAAQRSVRRSAPPNCGHLATQAEMNQCFAREATRVSTLLDTLLKEIRPSLDAGGRAGLEGAQRQWVRYRDAHCNWVASASEGGSIQPSVRATCLANVAWERIGELKLSLCGGAGLGGPCAASRRYDRPRDR